MRDVAWTFLGFLLALLVPGFLHYCAAVLVPENPEAITSWREHYYLAHRRWYGGFALWGGAAAVSATVNLGMSINHPARGVHVVSVVLGLIGCLSAKPRVHAVIVLTLAVLMIAASLSPNIDAGWMARP